MNHYEFLQRIYHNGIKQAKGADKKALTDARHLYNFACDIKKGMPEKSIRLAKMGLKTLYVEQDNEAYNLLWGALNALAS